MDNAVIEGMKATTNTNPAEKIFGAFCEDVTTTVINEILNSPKNTPLGQARIILGKKLAQIISDCGKARLNKLIDTTNEIGENVKDEVVDEIINDIITEANWKE